MISTSCGNGTYVGIVQQTLHGDGGIKPVLGGHYKDEESEDWRVRRDCGVSFPDTRTSGLALTRG